MLKDQFAPVTPGAMLKQEFLAEYGLSQNQLARAIGISPNRIAEIIHNRRRITADTAIRLSLFFGNSPEFWINLQPLRFEDGRAGIDRGRPETHSRQPSGVRRSAPAGYVAVCHSTPTPCNDC
jgi:antitoxin HigA-1